MKSSRLKFAQSVAQAFRHLWLLFVLSGLLTGSRADAQGTAFTYQGSLADGAAPANGTYDLRLTVFDAATGGSAVGNVTEVTGQAVADGLFTVTIDPGTGVFTGQGRWLELQVRTTGAPAYTTIAPRQALTPTPYAIRAATAATATVATTASSVPATGITGTLPLAQLPASVVVNGTSGLTLTKVPELVGQSSLAGGAVSVLAGDHYAGIAAGTAGLLIFDVADPAAPALVARMNDGIYTAGFAIDKDHAYLACGSRGLRTFSVTNIANPIYLSQAGGLALAHQVVIAGDYAYVGGNLETMVYSLADRSNPALVATLPNPGNTSSRVAVGGTTLYLVDGAALRTFSLAAPAAPVQVASVAAVGAQAVAVGGGHAYVACGGTGVKVFAVTVSPPTEVATLPVTGGQPVDVFVVGTRLYVANQGVGLQEWDVTAPAAPNLLKTYGVPDITGVVVLNNFAMTANSDAVGLRIVGLSQSLNFTAGFAQNAALGSAVGVTIGGGGAQTYIVETGGNGERQNVGGPNLAGGDFSTIGGGLSNRVALGAHAAVIAGGGLNSIGEDATVAAIGGGAGNRIGETSRNAVIAGGDNNSVGTNSPAASIGGGERNVITDNARGATIPGGFQNRAAGENSFAAGQQAKADHRGAFVWADANGGDFLSTAENQFSVRARGGVRFETGGAGVLVDGQPLGASGAARLNGGNTFTGNQTVNGYVNATSFTGNGFNLTSLNAGNLFGTVPEAQLPAAVARRNGGNAFEGDQSVNGAVSATSFVGSGAALTGLNAGNLAAGTVPDARLSANVPLLAAGKLNDAALSADVARRAGGNAFLGDQLVTGSVNATSVSGNGAGLTALNAANLASGVVPDARLSANVASRSGGNAFTGDQSVIGSVTATAFSGDGSDLTGLDAGNLTTGTLPNARLSANVPLLAGGTLNDSVLSGNVARRAGGNAFTGNQTVSGNMTATAFIGDGSQLTGIGGANPVQVLTASATAAPNTPYVVNSTYEITIDLPFTANVGDTVRVSGVGSGSWRLSGDIANGEPAGAVWTERYVWGGVTSVASSANGKKLFAAASNGPLLTSTDGGATWVAHESSRDWVAVASSADGAKLVAAVKGGQLYTSTDSGATWVARESNRHWSSVASSADGTKLVAAEGDLSVEGQLYTSTDSGVTWVARASVASWSSVASSADGTKLVAVKFNGLPHTSTDSGVTWVGRGFLRPWVSVASSADGTKLVAAAVETFYPGGIYTSANGGETWVSRADGSCFSVASSADGTKLIAGAGTTASPYIIRSTDSGATWNVAGPNAYPRGASAVASSADGSRLVAAFDDSGFYTSVRSLGGGSGQSVEVRYAENGEWLAVTPTGLNAAHLSTGTLPDARLSADVARRNGGNTFSGDQTVNGGLQVRHGSTATTPWPVRIENTGQATYLGGLRLSNDGFLDVANTARNGGNFARLNSGGNWTAVSDRRLKTDIASAEPLLDPALALRPVRFHYRADPVGPLQLGFIAQEVEAILPTLVTDGADVKTLDYASLSVVAIGAIQELNTKLETKLAAKDAEVAELKSRLEKLERLVNEKLGGGQ